MRARELANAPTLTAYRAVAGVGPHTSRATRFGDVKSTSSTHVDHVLEELFRSDTVELRSLLFPQNLNALEECDSLGSAGTVKVFPPRERRRGLGWHVQGELSSCVSTRRRGKQLCLPQDALARVSLSCGVGSRDVSDGPG